jgi:hypothetical protein
MHRLGNIGVNVEVLMGRNEIDMTDVVHIGLHKTGSTWLQKDVFTQSSYRKFISTQDNLGRQIFNHIIDASTSEWNPDMVRAYFTAFSSVVLSHESFSGRIWDGSPERFRTAQRLHDVLRNPRILIVLRSQPAMLTSLYAQYIHEGGWSNIHRFLDGTAEGLELDPSHLQYSYLVSRYFEIFGPSNVTVFPYELIRYDRAEFFRRLDSITGESFDASLSTTRNPTPSAWSINGLAIWNRLFRTSRFNARPIFPLRGSSRMRRVAQRIHVGGGPLSDRVGDATSLYANQYRIDNRVLQEMIPEFPLANWGYPL